MLNSFDINFTYFAKWEKSPQLAYASVLGFYPEGVMKVASVWCSGELAWVLLRRFGVGAVTQLAEGSSLGCDVQVCSSSTWKGETGDTKFQVQAHPLRLQSKSETSQGYRKEGEKENRVGRERGGRDLKLEV